MRPPPFESLLLVYVLAFIGGFLDAFTFVLKNGVLANSQTGNLVAVGVRITQKNISGAAEPMLPVVVFNVGLLFASLFKRKLVHKLPHFLHVCLLIEVILLSIIAVLPDTLPNYLFTMPISFACSLQFECFRIVRGVPCATTMITGNMRTSANFFIVFVCEKNFEAGKKALWLFIVNIAFLGGVFLGGYLFSYHGSLFSFIPATVLALTLAFILIYQKFGPQPKPKPPTRSRSQSGCAQLIVVPVNVVEMTQKENTETKP